jgi:hypothetical protein
MNQGDPGIGGHLRYHGSCLGNGHGIHHFACVKSKHHPAIAHANFPEQKLAVPAVFWYLILSGILSALYLTWVKRQRAGSAPAETERKE